MTHLHSVISHDTSTQCSILWHIYTVLYIMTHLHSALSYDTSTQCSAL